jgi:hypothetical protein
MSIKSPALSRIDSIANTRIISLLFRPPSLKVRVWGDHYEISLWEVWERKCLWVHPQVPSSRRTTTTTTTTTSDDSQLPTRNRSCRSVIVFLSVLFGTCSPTIAKGSPRVPEFN